MGKNIIASLLRRISNGAWLSYSQSGEDILIGVALKSLGISRGSYLDIGANHPSKLSNTYLFYREGWSGVCVEPDPALAKRLREARPRDTIVEMAVSTKEENIDLYRASDPSLNTVSKAQAAEITGSHHVTDTVRVAAAPIMQIIAKYCTETPAFVSLDAEGLDLEIIQSFDFAGCRPPIFCIETLTYAPGTRGEKIAGIGEVMEQNGYIVFADTHINTIYVDRALWEKA